MKATRLSKEEWNLLDNLISKHGVAGGYYDLVECIKMVIKKNWDDKLKDGWYETVNDLPLVVDLLMDVGYQSERSEPVIKDKPTVDMWDGWREYYARTHPRDWPC